jgi:hypothetical protein
MNRIVMTTASSAIALATVAGTTSSASAGVRPHQSGATGTIRVTVNHNYGTDHAQGRRICALALTNNNDKILGKCDTANANGIAVLKQVPAGYCKVGAYNGFQEPYTRSKAKVHVRAGHTTRFTFHLNEITLG